MSREVLWQGRGERITLEEGPDGWVIVHGKDTDSGGCRSICIPDEAIAAVAGRMFSRSARRCLDSIGRDFRRACETAGLTQRYQTCECGADVDVDERSQCDECGRTVIA